MPAGEMFHLSFPCKVVSFKKTNVEAIFNTEMYLLLSSVSSLAPQNTPYASPVLMHQKAPQMHRVTKPSIIYDHSSNFT